jgi:lysylphosphatidylglycerol synthetase-like protein (DUF2156 family)
MSLGQKVVEEIKRIGIVALYFALCFGVMMLCKRLILAQYAVEFRGVTFALVGALVVAKVVVLLENVSLGKWVRRQPVVVDVVLRTLLYTIGVWIVFLLEKSFESRHEHGGFGPSLMAVFQHRDIHHVWASTIGVCVALLGFIIFSVVKNRFGGHELKRLFLARRAPPQGADTPLGNETARGLP